MRNPRDVREVERRVLEAALHHGTIGYLDGKHSDASRSLMAQYPDNRDSTWQITQVIDHLVDVQCMTPMVNTEGQRLRAYAGGITPKGYERLRQLENPQWYWVKCNWFPLIVAAITFSFAAVDILIRLGLVAT